MRFRRVTRLRWGALLLPAAFVLALAGSTPAAFAASRPGTVIAWGTDAAGQTEVPVGLKDVVAIAAGTTQSLALKSNGTVVAWGCRGAAEPNPCTVPAGLSGVTAIAAFGTSLALKSDGTIVEWPCTVCTPGGPGGVVAIATGSTQLFLKGDGTVVAVGDTSGQIPMPTNLSDVTAIAVGGSHDLALKRDGTVVGWGVDNTVQSSVPPTLSGVTAISAGPWTSLALKSDGTVVAWGCWLALLHITAPCRPPDQLGGVKAVAAGSVFSLALKNDGTIVAWGDNSVGETSVPAGLTGVSAIAAGSQHSLAIVPSPASPGSLALDGTTGYAETPASADLNLAGPWTVEAWFKDEDPHGFNHANRTIVSKGDTAQSPEVPFFVQVGHNNIIAGLRAGGRNAMITWDLNQLGLNPTDWHHVAVTFNPALNVLNLWLDGKHVTYLVVAGHTTTGNALPLDIGRKGPTTGDYWLGKLADVRLWNVVRTGADITATYQTELTGPQAGLVANWYLDEGAGTSAASSVGGHPATLFGNAAFSSQTHP